VRGALTYVLEVDLLVAVLLLAAVDIRHDEDLEGRALGGGVGGEGVVGCMARR
jgi:hypothetical protein